jgi:uncharacterized membrane protein
MTTSRWYPITALVLAGLGFADATSLTIDHYSNFSLPCTITDGCEIVTNSAYSFILGIPVALLGALYYVSVLLAVYIILEFGAKHYLKYVAIASTAGFVFSAWFVYVQLFILHAICQYCMFSAASSTALFIASMTYLWQSSTGNQQSEPAKTSEISQ